MESQSLRLQNKKYAALRRELDAKWAYYESLFSQLTVFELWSMLKSNPTMPEHLKTGLTLHLSRRLWTEAAPIIGVVIITRIVLDALKKIQ